MLLQRDGVAVEEQHGGRRHGDALPDAQPQQQDVGEHTRRQARQVLNRRDGRDAAAGEGEQVQQERVAARALGREPDRIGPQGHVEVAPRVDGQKPRPVGERDGKPQQHTRGQDDKESGVLARQSRQGLLSRTAATERLH